MTRQPATTDNERAAGTRPLFLIGYMGCGKTTLGRALGRATGRAFYDLDFCIEQRFRCTVGQLFAARGESGFRAVEAAMLREVGEYDGAVIACGGGTPCFGDNMDYMLGRGDVVWLRADPARICSRLAESRSRRPLLAGLDDGELMAYVARHMSEREPFYSRAHRVFDSTELEDRRQIARAVRRFMAQ